MSKPHSAGRNTGHGQDASGFDRVEQIVLARLADELANRRELNIDRGGAQAPLLNGQGTGTVPGGGKLGLCL